MIISASNFVMHFCLIRWLSPEGYGKFVFIYSIGLFFMGIQNSLIFEPMLVIGAHNYERRIKKYLDATMIFSAILSILIGFILLFTFSFHTKAFALALYIFGVAGFMLMRNASYMIHKPSLAFKASFCYPIILVCLILIFRFEKLLSPETALLIISFSSIAVSLILRILLLSKIDDSLEENIPTVTKEKKLLSQVFHDHWEYGKWRFGGTINGWFNSLFYVPLIYTILGPVQAGAYKAIETLIDPLRRMLGALTMLIIPWITKNIKQGGKKYAKKATVKLILIFLSLTLIFTGGILLFGKQIVLLVYKKELYLDYLWLLPWMCVLLFINAINMSFGMIFSAQKITNIGFFIGLLNTLFTLTIGIYLVKHYGLQGVVTAMIINTLIGFSITAYIYKILHK